MKRALRAAFDPKVFLAKVGKGRTLADYKKKQTLFSQGDPADAILVAGQATLPKEVFGTKNGDHRFLALLGDNRELDLAGLNVEEQPRKGGLVVEQTNHTRLFQPHD
jgi:hypothetical protein